MYVRKMFSLLSVSFILWRLCRSYRNSREVLPERRGLPQCPVWECLEVDCTGPLGPGVVVVRTGLWETGPECPLPEDRTVPVADHQGTQLVLARGRDPALRQAVEYPETVRMDHPVTNPLKQLLTATIVKQQSSPI